MRLGGEWLALVAHALDKPYTHVVNYDTERHVMHIDTNTPLPSIGISLEEEMFLALKDGESLFFPHGDTGSSVSFLALRKKIYRAADKIGCRSKMRKAPDGNRFWLVR